jgi:hypothetical protein
LKFICQRRKNLEKEVKKKYVPHNVNYLQKKENINDISELQFLNTCNFESVRIILS